MTTLEFILFYYSLCAVYNILLHQSVQPSIVHNPASCYSQHYLIPHREFLYHGLVCRPLLDLFVLWLDTEHNTEHRNVHGRT